MEDNELSGRPKELLQMKMCTVCSCVTKEAWVII